MSILLDHKEIRRFSNTKNKINVLGCLEIDEVQDNILLLKTRENSFLKEQVGNWRGKPVVKFNILVENVLHKDVLFVVEQGADTVLDYDALGIRNLPAATTIITESRVADTITPKLVTEQAKRVISDTVKQGKKHLNTIVKEVAGTASKLVKQDIDTAIGNAIGELDVLREEILNDISLQNKVFYTDNTQKLTTIYAENTNTIIADSVSKLERAILDKSNSLKEVYDQQTNAIVKDNVKKIEQSVSKVVALQETKQNEIEELFEQRSNAIVRENLDRIEQSIKKVAAIQESKQLNLEKIKDIVQEARTYTTNSEKLLKEYAANTKRDIDHVRIQINRVAESGGGTNAVQYANGGIMNGNLHVTGRISGFISLSSLTQDEARVGDVVMWNGTNWVSTTTKVVSAIGDSTNKDFIITHNFNTFDVMVQVYDNNTNAVVYPAIQGNSLNDIKIEFSFVPSLNNYRVIIKQ